MADKPKSALRAQNWIHYLNPLIILSSLLLVVSVQLFVTAGREQTAQADYWVLRGCVHWHEANFAAGNELPGDGDVWCMQPSKQMVGLFIKVFYCLLLSIIFAFFGITVQEIPWNDDWCQSWRLFRHFFKKTRVIMVFAVLATALLLAGIVFIAFQIQIASVVYMPGYPEGEVSSQDEVLKPNELLWQILVATDYVVYTEESIWAFYFNMSGPPPSGNALVNLTYWQNQNQISTLSYYQNANAQLLLGIGAGFAMAYIAIMLVTSFYNKFEGVNEVAITDAYEG